VNSVPDTEGVGRYTTSLHSELNSISDVSATHYYIDKYNRSLTRIGSDGSETNIASPSWLSTISAGANNIHPKVGRLISIYGLARYIPGGHDRYHIMDQNMAGLAYYRDLNPTVLTIHDLAWLTQASSLVDPIVGRLIYNGIKVTDELITISAFTASELVREYPKLGGKPHTIYNGFDQEFGSHSEEEIYRIMTEYDLTGDNYILHLGEDKPTKNVKTLLQVLSKLPGNVKLLRTKPLQNNKDLIYELDLVDRIKTLGFVPGKDLPGLYAVADVYITTSYYEGFGLPPLEAMASGTPVVSSNTASLPEVVGDAGILCDPEDVNGFVKAINKILSNPDIKNKFQKLGEERAQRFSWEKCAKKTYSVYNEV